MKKLSVILLLTLCVATMAQAQATRTWVSGVGDDVNPCSRTAPCKTFAGAISKTGLWVPELKRFYSAVPKHYVLTARHGTDDIQVDLFKELSITQGVVKPPNAGWQTSILSDLIAEDAHLMVFDYAP